MEQFLSIASQRIGEQSIEEIYQAHWKKIYNYAYGRLLNRAAAEDVAAEVFALAVEHRDSFRTERGTIEAWLGTITHNVMVNLYRKKAQRQEVAMWDMPEKPHHETAFGDEGESRVEYILRQLSDEERDFLELRYAVGLSNEEVAKALGTTANAISHRYTRLLAKCRQLDANAIS